MQFRQAHDLDTDRLDPRRFERGGLRHGRPAPGSVTTLRFAPIERLREAIVVVLVRAGLVR